MKRIILGLFYGLTQLGVVNAEVNTSFTGMAGIETNRQTETSTEGVVAPYVAPEAGVEWVLPKMGKHLPKFGVDLSGDYFFEYGQDLSLELRGSLEQDKGTQTWVESLKGGYSEVSSSEDQTQPSKYFWTEGAGEIKYPFKHPLKIRASLNYLQESETESETNRFDLKPALSGQVSFHLFENFFPSLGLSLQYNYSSEKEYSFSGISLPLIFIYMLNNEYYLVGLINYSHRVYIYAEPTIPQGGPPGQSKKNEAVNGLDILFLNLSLYRELTQYLEAVVEVSILSNNYSNEPVKPSEADSEEAGGTPDYNTLRLGIGLSAQF